MQTTERGALRSGGRRRPSSRAAWRGVGGAAVVVVLGWLAAPWVSMARRGTVDARTVRSWCDEPPAPRLPHPRAPADDVHCARRG